MNKYIRIGIVRSTYYEKIEQLMHGAALDVIDSNNNNNRFFKEHNIQYLNINVLGSFEIPQLISRHVDEFDAFIALGCIIKGETPHFDFISKSITDGLMKISIENKKPIGNGVLTCLNKKQAQERSQGKRNKGAEATKAVIHSLITSHVIKNDNLSSDDWSEFTNLSIYDED